MGSRLQSGIFPGLSEIGGAQPIFSAGQGCTSFEQMRFRNFFDQILSGVFVQNASLSPYMHFTNAMVDKKKKQNVHGKKHI